MALRDILELGDERLRRRAVRVSRFDESVRSLAADLLQTVHSALGAGLAAPQIGVPLRVFVAALDGRDLVFCNPELVRAEGKCSFTERCLSIPMRAGLVVRPERVVVKAHDERGRFFRLSASGTLARAIQHERDHLDGVLFIDRIADPGRLWILRPESN